jgi:hypothetical protein
MIEEDNSAKPLSDAGRLRYREILRLAIAAGRHRRASRRAITAAIFGLLIFLTVAWLAWHCALPIHAASRPLGSVLFSPHEGAAA